MRFIKTRKLTPKLTKINALYMVRQEFEITFGVKYKGKLLFKRTFISRKKDNPKKISGNSVFYIISF